MLQNISIIAIEEALPSLDVWFDGYPRLWIFRPGLQSRLIPSNQNADTSSLLKRTHPRSHLCAQINPRLYSNRSDGGHRVDYSQIITIDPGRRSGKACIRDTRITVYDILDYMASGMSQEEILADFPDLTETDIRACLAFAADGERRFEVVTTCRQPRTSTQIPAIFGIADFVALLTIKYDSMPWNRVLPSSPKIPISGREAFFAAARLRSSGFALVTAQPSVLRSDQPCFAHSRLPFARRRKLFRSEASQIDG